jgi:membrane protein required for colicin V production
MNILDIVILVIILVSAALGALSGFARAAMNLAAIIGASYICYVWGGQAGAVLFGDDGSAAVAGGYAAAFFAPLIAFSVLATMTRRLLRIAGLGGWDSGGGMVFGAARGALIVGALLVPLAFTPLADSAMWRESAALPYFGRALAATADSSPRLGALYEYIGFDAGDRPLAAIPVVLRDAAARAAREQELNAREVVEKLKRAQSGAGSHKLADEEALINQYQQFAKMAEGASEEEREEARRAMAELNPESYSAIQEYLQTLGEVSGGDNKPEGEK